MLQSQASSHLPSQSIFGQAPKLAAECTLTRQQEHLASHQITSEFRRGYEQCVSLLLKMSVTDG